MTDRKHSERFLNVNICSSYSKISPLTREGSGGMHRWIKICRLHTGGMHEWKFPGKEISPRALCKASSLGSGVLCIFRPSALKCRNGLPLRPSFPYTEKDTNLRWQSAGWVANSRCGNHVSSVSSQNGARIVCMDRGGNGFTWVLEEEYVHGHHVAGFDLALVVPEQSSQTPVCNLGLHDLVQHDVSCFYVTMCKDRVTLFMQICQTICNPHQYVHPAPPIQVPLPF